MLALKPFAVACAAACAAIAIQAGATAAEAGTLAPALPRTVIVTNLRSSGPGSLRAAIHAVNASPPAASSTIRFWVRGVITLSQLAARGLCAR